MNRYLALVTLLLLGCPGDTAPSAIDASVKPAPPAGTPLIVDEPSPLHIGVSANMFPISPRLPRYLLPYLEAGGYLCRS